jgi:hypothetical protein
MAFTCREIPVPVSDVFRVVVDPETYPTWLIGATSIRSVDDRWPEPGSAFHHRIGLGPMSIPDRSTVIAIVTDELLVLSVRVRPFITAVVTFRLVGDDQRCVITMEEEPALRFVGNVVRPVMDPLVHVRNHRSLRRLVGRFRGGSDEDVDEGRTTQ